MKQSVFASWPFAVELQAMPSTDGVPLTQSWGCAVRSGGARSLPAESDPRKRALAAPRRGVRGTLLAVFGPGRDVCAAAESPPSAAPQSTDAARKTGVTRRLCRFDFIHSPSRKGLTTSFFLPIRRFARN